jgi:hypothetical protein
MRDKRPPEELTEYELRERLIRQARKIVRECELDINTVEYWMRHHPDEEPIDIEPFRVYRAYGMSILKHFGEQP